MISATVFCDTCQPSGTYPLGVSVSSERMRALPITAHSERGTWNYTIHPAGHGAQPEAGAKDQEHDRRQALHALADPRLTSMSRAEPDQLAAELAPVQAARTEQRLFEQRGGPRRQARASTAGAVSSRTPTKS